MGKSAQFIVELKDDKQRRIIIDQKAWNELGLEKGDYIFVTISKIRLEDVDEFNHTLRKHQAMFGSLKSSE